MPIGTPPRPVAGFLKDRLIAEHRMKNLTIALLAGCAIISTAQAASQPDVALAKRYTKYYNEHLSEAKQVMNECLAKAKANGVSTIQGEELIKCKAASNAWEFQVYRPKRPTFSSSGGRN